MDISPENMSMLKGMPVLAGALFVVVILLVIWSFIWKGISLWKCGRNNQKVWYIVLLIVNTAGILEILYLLFFQKNKNQPVNPQ